MRILLVDDEQLFAKQIAERLELVGMETCMAGDGNTAQRLFRAGDPWDVVFLDIAIPGINGLDLLKTIKNECPEQPVIMLSGSTDIAKAAEAMQHGAFGWLSKPVEFSKMLAECERVRQFQEKRREEARLVEVARLELLGRVSRGVAHEVNNPVNIVIHAAGHIQDIIEDIPEGVLAERQEVLDDLDIIQQQGKRIGMITRKLLMLGHKMDRQARPLDVQKHIDRVMSLMGARLEKNGIEVKTDLSSTENRPVGSAIELEQISLHVVENAVDAMPNGGTIRISGKSAQQGNHANGKAVYELSFQDSGPGIANEIADKIFEPFFTTRTDKPGQYVGLGLSVARSLASERGGKLEAVKTATGGACFVLSMPAVASSCME